MRIIKIKTCDGCPFRGTSNSDPRIKYIPTCTYRVPRELPYTRKISGQQIIAISMDIIPEWCPLEEVKD